MDPGEALSVLGCLGFLGPECISGPFSPWSQPEFQSWKSPRILSFQGRKLMATEGRWPAKVPRPYEARLAPEPGPTARVHSPVPAGVRSPGKGLGERLVSLWPSSVASPISMLCPHTLHLVSLRALTLLPTSYLLTHI